MEYEYARDSSSSTGLVRRAAESTDDWLPCPQDDVPAAFFHEEAKSGARRLGMLDAPDVPDGGTFLASKVDGTSGFVAVRHPNPEVSAVAAELGLTDDQLRERLNGAPGGTNLRVSEGRFDEIATSLGLDPADARDRFADRS